MARPLLPSSILIRSEKEEEPRPDAFSGHRIVKVIHLEHDHYTEDSYEVTMDWSSSFPIIYSYLLFVDP